MPSAETPTVIDVNAHDFEVQVLQESHHRPVLVDFWAPWCGPCRALGPTLEKVAQEEAGAFLLAKLNTDENQELATRYRIRGIPAVKAFVDGKVVHEFTGALPESAIRQFLRKVIPAEGAKLAEEAMRLFAAGDVERAEAVSQQALHLQPNAYLAVVVRAEIAIERGELDSARALLEGISRMPDIEDAYECAAARLALATRLREHDVPLTAPLDAATAPEGASADTLLNAAALHALRGSLEEAGRLALDVLTFHRKTHKDIAHQLVLSLIRLAPAEIARDLRRRLSIALY